MKTAKPVLSVIIPTYNRVDDLDKCLEVLAGQRNCNYNFEVIVIDDQSDPDIFANYREIVADLKGKLDISLYRLSGHDSGAVQARNHGFEKARGKYIGLLDDDSIPALDWVETLVDYFETHPGITAVTGCIEAVDLSNPLSAFRQNMYNKRFNDMLEPGRNRLIQEKYGIAVRENGDENNGFGDIYLAEYISGGNSGFRKEILAEIGKFNINFKMMHDKEFALRLMSEDYLCAFVPDLKIEHNHTTSVLDSLRKAFKSGKYHFRLRELYSDYLQDKVLYLLKPFKIAANSFSLLPQLNYKIIFLVPIIIILEYLHQLGYLLARKEN